MAAKDKQNINRATPDELDDKSSPRGYVGHHDHSFTLQAIMELQRSVGQLTGSVDSLRLSIDSQKEKINKLEEKLSGVTHKIYAAGVVLAILLAIGGFVVSKAWDMMAHKITSETVTQAVKQKADTEQ